MGKFSSRIPLELVMKTDSNGGLNDSELLNRDPVAVDVSSETCNSLNVENLDAKHFEGQIQADLDICMYH